MYPKNAASPERIAIGAVVQISDGAVQTSGCTITVRGQGGAEATGGGTAVYGATGIVYYTPTQAETDYTSFVLIASKSGCIPASVTVVTTAESTAGTVKLGATQTVAITGNITGNLSGSVGSVTGNVGGIAGTITTLDALDTAQDSQHATTQAAIAVVDGVADAILVDTNELQTNQGNWVTATGFAVPGDQMDFVNAPNATAVTAIQSGLATAANLATVAGYLDTEIAAILTVTDKLDTALEDDGASGWQYTTLAMDNVSATVSGNVTVEALTQAALAQFATDDTGETTAAAGSVAKLGQGTSDTAAIVAGVLTGLASTEIGQDIDINAEIRYITRGDSYDGTANAVLSWTVSKDYTSGWTGTMTIRHRVTGASLAAVSVTAASSTLLTATLTTSDTAFALLVSDSEFGPHPYDVQMDDGTSQITVVPDGIAVIRKDATTT